MDLSRYSEEINMDLRFALDSLDSRCGCGALLNDVDRCLDGCDDEVEMIEVYCSECDGFIRKVSAPAPACRVLCRDCAKVGV